MSVTVKQYKNLVGGEWVDAAEGTTMEVPTAEARCMGPESLPI